MTKIKKSVTFDKYIFDTYLSSCGNNLSNYLQKLIIVASEQLINNKDDYKRRILELVRENETLKIELNNIKAQLARKAEQKQRTLGLFELIEKYNINDNQKQILRETKAIIDKRPETLNANLIRFNNISGNTIKKAEFLLLINGV